MGFLSNVLRMVTVSSREFSVSAVSGVELARQQLYLIRRHYANSGRGSDGTEDCPLYYAPIEGLGGSSELTLALLKDLPKRGSKKDPQRDYRMVSVFNHVPKMIRTDVSCLLNEFSWNRVKVELSENGRDWSEDETLSAFVQGVFTSAETRGTWSLRAMISTGAAAGDAYARVAPDVTTEEKVSVRLALAEGVYPAFDPWNHAKAVGYRSIYKVLAEPLTSEPDGQLSTAAVSEVHTEILDETGVQVFRDNVPMIRDAAGNQLSGSHSEQLDELPMVHVAYLDDAGEFFGIPCANSDVIADIDGANVKCANLKNMVDGVFGTPNLFFSGMSDTGNFMWGRRGVHGLPAGAEAKLLYFDGLADLITEVQQASMDLKDKIVQFIIDDIRRGTSQDSGVALAIRLFPYDTYLDACEQQQGRGLEDIARIALKVAGKFPAGRKMRLKVDWGARFPVDVMARLQVAEKSVALFGPAPELIEELARREGYSPEIIDAIKKRLTEKQETEAQAAATNAFGGGLLGAQAAQQQKQQRLLGLGAGPAGKPNPNALPPAPGGAQK